jgi:DNA processing protein
VKSIKTIDINNKDYPKLLRKIKNPPNVLYYQGKILSDEKCFAVVGTRRCSLYGKQAALEITGDLAEAGLTIVSGLAPGIDAFAHKATVERGRRTIAVLGTGLDEKSLYPKENISLARKIVESGGLLLSEYPPGTRASRFTFPQRNRLISGLSLAILVVEAKEKSGSLITANWAFSQKRKVFAVPGPIHSLNSRGTNFLIKQGAKLTEKADDILKELKLPESTASSKPPRSGSKEENIILEILNEKTLHIDEVIKRQNCRPRK